MTEQELQTAMMAIRELIRERQARGLADGYETTATVAAWKDLAQHLGVETPTEDD